MAAGLQVWNDSSYLQVDGQNQHICLLRKGAVASTQLTNGRNTVAASMFTIPVNSGEIAAINGPGQFNLAGMYAGSWQCHAYNAGAGSVFNYWVFGPYVPSGTNVGMEVYNEAGGLIWDTGRLPIRVVGDVAGLGSFTVGESGRTYAIYPTQLYARMMRTVTAIIGNNTAVLTTEFWGGFGGISGQTLTTLQASYLYSISNAINSSQVPNGWNADVTNNLQNTFTVLDVTGY